MIAGIRGDAEGNWTQEQIMQCYKVFKPNCSGWQVCVIVELSLHLVDA